MLVKTYASSLFVELSLDGKLERVKGALPMAFNARKEGFKGIILPEPNAEEAGVISDLDVYGMENILQVVAFLSDRHHLNPVRLNPERIFEKKVNHFELDFSEVKGQARVRRTLEIAASGSHNLLTLYAVSPQIVFVIRFASSYTGCQGFSQYSKNHRSGSRQSSYLELMPLSPNLSVSEGNSLVLLSTHFHISIRILLKKCQPCLKKLRKDSSTGSGSAGLIAFQ